MQLKNEDKGICVFKKKSLDIFYLGENVKEN
jgi:hypothetical protein